MVRWLGNAVVLAYTSKTVEVEVQQYSIFQQFPAIQFPQQASNQLLLVDQKTIEMF